MPYALSLVLLIVLVCSGIARGEDFILTVNGVPKEINLDQEQILDLPDGTSLTVKVNQKEILRFTSTLFSFDHQNRYKPNQSDLGDGIKQTMIVTPRGTGVIIQEYLQLNPVHQVDTLLNELTKEERDYGYQYREKKVTRQAGAITFRGKEAVTSYPGEEWTRTVLACGGKDKGLVIITFIEKDRYQDEQGLAEGLWQSLRVLSSGCTP